MELPFYSNKSIYMSLENYEADREDHEPYSLPVDSTVVKLTR